MQTEKHITWNILNTLQYPSDIFEILSDVPMKICPKQKKTGGKKFSNHRCNIPQTIRKVKYLATQIRGSCSITMSLNKFCHVPSFFNLQLSSTLPTATPRVHHQLYASPTTPPNGPLVHLQSTKAWTLPYTTRRRVHMCRDQACYEYTTIRGTRFPSFFSTVIRGKKTRKALIVNRSITSRM